MIYLDIAKDQTVKQIISKTFPGFKGKTVSCEITHRITFIGTNWSGGFKKTYKVLRITDMRYLSIPEANWINPETMYTTSQTIPADCVVVCHTFGPREYITIFSPSELTNQGITNEELTTEEKIVLAATRSYKNSYAGIKNYRFQEAKRTGITEEIWNKTKEECINKGYLNKAGAITTKGRNLIGRTELYQLELK